MKQWLYTDLAREDDVLAGIIIGIFVLTLWAAWRFYRSVVDARRARRRADMKAELAKRIKAREWARREEARQAAMRPLEENWQTLSAELGLDRSMN